MEKHTAPVERILSDLDELYELGELRRVLGYLYPGAEYHRGQSDEGLPFVSFQDPSGALEVFVEGAGPWVVIDRSGITPQVLGLSDLSLVAAVKQAAANVIADCIDGEQEVVFIGPFPKSLVVRYNGLAGPYIAPGTRPDQLVAPPPPRRLHELGTCRDGTI